MINRTKLYALCIAPILSFTGCGDDDDDGKGIVEETQDTVANLIEAYELAGTWTSACAGFNAFSDLLDASAKEIIVFGGNNQNLNYSIYSDAQCEEEVAKLRYMGNYALEEDAQERDQYVEIDTTIKNVFLTPRTQPFVDTLNTASWCGISNWQVDQEQEITANLGQGTCQLPVRLQQTTFGLIQVDGDKLYRSSPLSPAPTSEDGRPTSVNRDVVYQRT